MDPDDALECPQCGETMSTTAYATLKEQLLELLARIHGDGGHYTEEHGLDKSVADADLIAAENAGITRAAIAYVAILVAPGPALLGEAHRNLKLEVEGLLKRRKKPEHWSKGQDPGDVFD